MSLRFVRIEPGQVVGFEGKQWTIKHGIDLDRVLAYDNDGDLKVLQVASLRLIPPAEVEDAQAKAVSISEADRTEMDRRFQAIEPVLNLGKTTTLDMVKRANEVGKGVATLYRWRKAYEKSGSKLALIGKNPGRVPDFKKIDPVVEKLLEVEIERLFLTGQKVSVSKFVREFRRICNGAKVLCPHANTIRSRIRRIPGGVIAKTRGSRRDREKYESTPGKNPQGRYPLADFQIDHTELPIIVVDDETRQAIGRPWITLVIEVCTRVVAGYYISLDPPSSTSVAMALACAMTPKEKLLSQFGVSGRWEVWGKPDCIHADNALEFRGEALKYGCEEIGINIQWRPVKKPRYGAHIERILGTLGLELNTWSGATFSNIKQKADYDSVGMAVYSMKELEGSLLEWIVNVYHESRHAGLGGRTPIGLWKSILLGTDSAPGRGIPPRPADPDKLYIEFLPVERRVVTPSGVKIDTLKYWDDELRPFVGEKNAKEKDGKYIFRIDDRALSPIYFLHPQSAEYVPIHFSDLSKQVPSRWQVRSAKVLLKADGIADLDEKKVFEALDRLEKRATDSAKNTKERRDQQRARQIKDRANKRQPSNPAATSGQPKTHSPRPGLTDAVIDISFETGEPIQ